MQLQRGCARRQLKTVARILASSPEAHTHQIHENQAVEFDCWAGAGLAGWRGVLEPPASPVQSSRLGSGAAAMLEMPALPCHVCRDTSIHWAWVRVGLDVSHARTRQGRDKGQARIEGWPTSLPFSSFLTVCEVRVGWDEMGRNIESDRTWARRERTDVKKGGVKAQVYSVRVRADIVLVLRLVGGFEAFGVDQKSFWDES